MKETKGYIYILTNPSFPEYVKIGYAEDVERRLRELNRSECIPFAFRVYATYEVNSALSDKKVHEIIDRLNPDLRSIDTLDGKERKREFYAMSPEDAYNLLESIAEINGLSDKLVLVKPKNHEVEAIKLAEEIAVEQSTRNENFSFEKCNIPVGAVLDYIYDEHIKCTVVTDRKVEYNGQTMYLTGLAKLLLNRKTGVCGPAYFKYNGKYLNEYYNKYQRNEN